MSLRRCWVRRWRVVLVNPQPELPCCVAPTLRVPAAVCPISNPSYTVSPMGPSSDLNQYLFVRAPLKRLHWRFSSVLKQRLCGNPCRVAEETSPKLSVKSNHLQVLQRVCGRFPEIPNNKFIHQYFRTQGDDLIYVGKTPLIVCRVREISSEDRRVFCGSHFVSGDRSRGVADFHMSRDRREDERSVVHFVDIWRSDQPGLLLSRTAEN